MLLTRCGHTGYETKEALLAKSPKGSSSKIPQNHQILSADPHLDLIS